jgi:hypothetical protein
MSVTSLRSVIAIVAVFLLTAVLAGRAAGGPVTLRLQAGFLQEPGAPPPPCPLASSWGAFIIKHLDAGGDPVSADERVDSDFAIDSGMCFFEQSISLPNGSYRIVATDGAIVRTCNLTVTSADSVTAFFHKSGAPCGGAGTSPDE